MKLILIAFFLALTSATAASALLPTPIIVDGKCVMYCSG